MTGRIRDLIVWAAVLLFFWGAGFVTGYKSRKNGPNLKTITKVDTLFVSDTIIDYTPIKTAIPAGVKMVAVTQDSESPTVAERHDTVYVTVPITETTFTDGKTYECAVTGYDTQMLWHKSFQETAIVTKSVPTTPNWAISPFVSVTAGNSLFRTEAGVKLDLWKGRWVFSPSVSYGVGTSPGVGASFAVSYNMIYK